jgi:ribonuclease VapC
MSVILDTSAIVAAIREESGHDRVLAAIESATEIGMGAPTALECSIVLMGRYGLVGRLILSRFLEANRVISIPFDDRHWDVATDAHIRYGKGRHPARLNYGDCMAYATAKVADAPLLYVGNDFSQTDVAAALLSSDD